MNYKILSITDTRQYEEIGDEWFPIPGSGDEHECERCGKIHEIHFEIQDENKNIFIVGGSCSKLYGIPYNSKIKKVVCDRKRELKDWNYAIIEDSRREIQNVVNTMNIPEYKVENITTASGSSCYIVKMQDAIVWLHESPVVNEERKTCLINAWRDKRVFELMEQKNG